MESVRRDPSADADSLCQRRSVIDGKPYPGQALGHIMQLRSYLNGTHLIDLHGRHMKSPEVAELLERFNLDVIYRFDRSFEGTPDQYSVAARQEGFELCFDEEQNLETIWCYLQARNGFDPIDPDCPGVLIPATLVEAEQSAINAGRTFRKFGEGQDASLRIESADLWVHYEFSDSRLSLVTLMRPWQ